MLVGYNCTDVLFCRKCEVRRTRLRRARCYLTTHARYQKARTRKSIEDNYQEKLDRHGGERGKNVRGVTVRNIYRQLKVDTGVAMAQCISHDLFEGAIKVRKINFFFSRNKHLPFISNHCFCSKSDILIFFHFYRKIW